NSAIASSPALFLCGAALTLPLAGRRAVATFPIVPGYRQHVGRSPGPALAPGLVVCQPTDQGSATTKKKPRRTKRKGLLRRKTLERFNSCASRNSEVYVPIPIQLLAFRNIDARNGRRLLLALASHPANRIAIHLVSRGCDDRVILERD